MTFDWRLYLEFAQALASENDEARERSAVSRAYYSAFCIARDWLTEHEKKFTMPNPGESHKIVWDTFDNGPEQVKKWIAKEGRKLRNSRNNADYDSEVFGLKEMVQISLKRAEGIVEKI